MGNLISVLSHCGRGDEMLLGDMAHIFLYEQAARRRWVACIPTPCPISRTARWTSPRWPTFAAKTSTFRSHGCCLENTHNRCGGRVLPVAYVDAVGALAHAVGCDCMWMAPGCGMRRWPWASLRPSGGAG